MILAVKYQELERLGIPTDNTEGYIRDRLAEILDGITEVTCPVGRIDVLTDTEVIEIKQAKDWEDAVGQVLAYKFYYPNHSPRIHLYVLRYFNREIAVRISNSLGVTVTFEE